MQESGIKIIDGCQATFTAPTIDSADQFSGGDKPHSYQFGETSLVMAGFIPAN